MRIFILFFTSLREITGKREETMVFPEGEEVTLNHVIKSLGEKYGKNFVDYIYDSKTHEVKGFLQFLVNGKIAAEGLLTSLDDGDVLAILPPVGGG